MLLRQVELMKKAGNRILVVISCHEGEACDSYMTFCRQYHIEMISAVYQVCNQSDDLDIIAVVDNYEPLKNRAVKSAGHLPFAPA